jgi:hypothetical protein
MFDLANSIGWTPCVLDLIHVANVLYLASYLLRDILWLRILTVVAIMILMPYYFSCSDTPLWAAISWQAVFAVVNLFQIFLLMKERWPRNLQGDERHLYDTIFSDLTPGEFVKLLGVGGWRSTSPDEPLVADGSVVHEMMVLTDGELEVRKGDKVLARLKPGQFVGEMSFLTGDKAGADVVSAGAAKLMSWPQDALEKFLAKNGVLSFKVRGVLGRDVVTKLRAH